MRTLSARLAALSLGWLLASCGGSSGSSTEDFFGDGGGLLDVQSDTSLPEASTGHRDGAIDAAADVSADTPVDTGRDAARDVSGDAHLDGPVVPDDGARPPPDGASADVSSNDASTPNDALLSDAGVLDGALPLSDAALPDASGADSAGDASPVPTDTGAHADVVAPDAAPACVSTGAQCGVGADCCSGACQLGVCVPCIGDSFTCGAGQGECCSGNCQGGTCQALPTGGCRALGNACQTGTDCCSSRCEGGFCANASFCVQSGDGCGSDGECCSGWCEKQGGASKGLCKVPSVPGGTGCSVAGTVCADALSFSDGGIPSCGGECCSRSCAPYGPTGAFVCQPASGCRPTGEICREDGDCCGAPGMPGGNGSVRCSKASPSDPVGRCDNGNACRPDGAVCKLATSSCNAENNCCSGNVNQNPLVCQRDNLGVPRCTGVGDCALSGSKEGASCATSADCCGLACVPNPAGTPPFVCGAVCVEKGGACTTHADCCPGYPCVLEFGSSVGICGGTTSGPDAGVDAGVDGADAAPTGNDGATSTDGGSMDGTTADASQLDAGTDSTVGLPDAGADAGGQGGTDATVSSDTGGDGGTSADASGDSSLDAGAGGDSSTDAGGPISCSLYGQTCRVSTDCCNGISCISGRCITN